MMNARAKAKFSIAFLSVALMTLLMPALAFADPIEDHAIDISTESNVPGEELYFDSPSAAIVSPEGALLETLHSASALPAENSNGGSDLSANEDTESQDLDEVPSDVDDSTPSVSDGQEQVDNVSGFEPDATVQSEFVAQDEAGYCGNGVVWTFTDSGTLTITSDGSGDGAIEASAGQTSLSSIASTVQSILIEQGITSIGDYAFQNFNALQYVSIAGSVSSIGFQAFANCSQLATVDFAGASSLQTIGQAAFYNTAINSLVIPDSVSNIGAEAFLDCNALSSVQIGTDASNLNSIDMNAFGSGSAFAFVKYYGTETQWNSLSISEGNDRLTTSQIVFSNPSYQITFDPNGGSFGGAPGAILYTNENGTLGDHAVLPTPSFDNHSFDGWFDSQFGGNEITMNTPFYGNTTVWAHWTENDPEPVSYTVVFDATDGEFDGSGKTMTISTNTNGYLDQQPDKPKYSLHLFEGWFTAADGGDKVDLSQPITGNDTYYAHWMPVSEAHYVNVYFESNGGVFNDYSNSTKTVQTDAHGFVTSAPVVTRENYIFLGWSYSANHGSEVLDLQSTSFTVNTTLYAQWQQDYNAPVEYTVTFYLNDGVSTGAIATLTTSTFGGSHQLSTLPAAPSRFGYIFKGWTNATDGGDPVDLSTPFFADASAYAQWDVDTSQPRYYTITLDANGGTLNCSTVLETDGTGMLAEPSAPEREGYRFDGWLDLFNNPVNFADPFTQNEYLYAQWTPVSVVPTPTGSFTITFDADGGTLASSASLVTNEYGMLAEPTAPEFADHEFAGWFDAAGNRIDFSVPFTSDVTVYAHWTDSTVTPPAPSGPVTVTFDANGGTLSGEAYFTTDGQGKLAFVASAPTWEGHEFAGWFDALTGGSRVSTSTVFTADTTVYARWNTLTTPPDDPNTPGDDPIKPGDDDPNTPGDDPSTPTYTVIEGANGNWIAENDEDLVIRADGAFADFDHVKIDGEKLHEMHYSVREGSTIVTLSRSYLATLGEGIHEIRFVYKDGGEAKTNFSVQTKPAVYNPSDADTSLTQVDTVTGTEATDSQVPKTGDATPMSMYAYLMLMAIACIVAAKVRRRRVQ